MVGEDSSREMPSAEVKLRLTDSLKSCKKVVDGYRQLLTQDSGSLWKGWKR